ncbi:MAG TPA: ATP synthase F1 subunit epsilon [Acidimicrobiales bacterium]|nr:ATP synthase F1 subunit epsilon [Acidimicrobiales bacterium]
MRVELVSPERILFSGEGEMVVCRTVDGGDIAFLSNHAPFLGALDIGAVKIKTDGDEKLAAVHGGFVHVREDTVILLSDVAELAEDIDVDRARRAKEAAERKEGDMDEEEAQAAVRRAEVRLEVAG